MLLLCSMPDALPVSSRRGGSEEGDSLLEQLRRSILRGELETLLELLLSPIPVTLAIGHQAMSEQVTECKRVGRNLTGPTQELKDPDWLGIPYHRHEVQLARLHGLLGQAIGVLRYNNPRLVQLINPLKARGRIHDIADHRVRPGRLRPNGADHYLTSGKPHTHLEIWYIAPQTEEMWQLAAKRVNRFLLEEGGETGIRGVLITRREGRGPEGHDPIANILVNDAAMVADGLGHGREVSVQEVDHSTGSQLFAQRTETFDVGEKHGNDTALGSVRMLTGRANESRDNTGIHVFAK